MKKFLCFILCLGMVGSLIACGDSSTIDKASEEVEKEATESETESLSASEEETEKRTQSSTAENTTPAPTESAQDLSNGDIDVDLTKLSSTMVYSEVNNMMQHPDDYVGKKIKMKGAFSPYETEARNYYSCIIADATACCKQGVEFLWAGEHQYPADYPKSGAEIVVVGIYDLYYEGEDLYFQLKDATLEF